MQCNKIWVATGSATMSRLKRVVTVSMACNFLQVIGVARERIQIVRQVYQNGELDPAPTHHATRLDDLSKRIWTATMPTITAPPKVPYSKASPNQGRLIRTRTC